MKKYRIMAAATLLLLPSMFFSSPGFSTSELPPIGIGADRFGQQNCPTGSGAGCFSPGGATGPEAMIGFVVVNADRFRREGFSTCLEIMRQLQNLAAGTG